MPNAHPKREGVQDESPRESLGLFPVKMNHPCWNPGFPIATASSIHTTHLCIAPGCGKMVQTYGWKDGSNFDTQ